MVSPQSLTSAWNTIAPYLALFKLRIVVMLLMVAGASATIAQRGLPPGNRLGLLLLAGALASAGASVLNHYLDRDIDALMERTRHRPLPAGRIKHPERAAILGVVLLLSALGVSIHLNPWATLYIILGAMFYVVVYTWWLKRRTQVNVILGGGAGSFAVLAGWAAVEPRLSPLAWLIALLVFLWTPLHFWNFALVNLSDYRLARVPMMPTIVDRDTARWYIGGAALALFTSSLFPGLLGYLGGYYLISALALSPLLWGNLRPVEDARVAWKNYKLSSLYLVGILGAMVIDTLLNLT